MSEKSAHRGVGLWSYERPSRSYFGFHLRARTSDARNRFRDRLAALEPGVPHLFRLGRDIADCSGASWPQTIYGEVMITSGEKPEPGGDLALALEPTELKSLIKLLDSVAPEREASVTVQGPAGSYPLWVWWDAI